MDGNKNSVNLGVASQLKTANQRNARQDENMDDNKRENNLQKKDCNKFTPIGMRSQSTNSVSCSNQQEPISNWKLSDFEVGKKIGEGQHGCVYNAREIRSKYRVALKVIYKSKLASIGQTHYLAREIEIQSRLSHPNVLQLFGYFFDEYRIYLILELAWFGNLFEHLKKQPQGRLEEKEVTKVVRQLASALLYCHSQNVIHRDIKPENIVLDHEGNFKLADWGSSVHAPSTTRKTFVGTRDYLAPELIEGKRYDKYADYWSLGVLTYEMLTGQPPFDHRSQLETYKRIVSVDLKFPNHVSSGARDLVRRLLTRKPADRIDLKSILNHTWIKENLDK